MDRFQGILLKGPQAYECVPYITGDSNGGWMCELCGTGVMPSSTVCRAHCNGSRHQSNYNQLETLLTESNELSVRRDKVEDITTRMNNIRHPKWKNHVKALVLDFMLSQRTFDDALLLIIMYEQWERFACLELAIWKYCCLSDGRFSCMQEIGDYWALDETFDPKKYKQEARLSGLAGAIFSRVKSFL
jgi:hypothetical protein